MTVILPQIERSDSSGRWDYAVISWRRSYHRTEYLYVDSGIRTTCSPSTSSGTNTSDSPRASNFATTAQFRVSAIPPQRAPTDSEAFPWNIFYINVDAATGHFSTQSARKEVVDMIVPPMKSLNTLLAR
ncbi:uncharacterized protein ARMOST_14182 [Armillaria ostoyae]|uniref:Uncharacterized protein n=1 Tax=Armillaria ostoyae TaxID=47428 RepID=A0A284RPY3_ARMOS|nr:uncharacterized protein ARMOST_14182 [Armillaria ostoyae]